MYDIAGLKVTLSFFLGIFFLVLFFFLLVTVGIYSLHDRRDILRVVIAFHSSLTLTRINMFVFVFLVVMLIITFFIFLAAMLIITFFVLLVVTVIIISFNNLVVILSLLVTISIVVFSLVFFSRSYSFQNPAVQLIMPQFLTLYAIFWYFLLLNFLGISFEGRVFIFNSNPNAIGEFL